MNRHAPHPATMQPGYAGDVCCAVCGDDWPCSPEAEAAFLYILGYDRSRPADPAPATTLAAAFERVAPWVEELQYVATARQRVFAAIPSAQKVGVSNLSPEFIADLALVLDAAWRYLDACD